ncbi:hypothetical protein ACFX2I_025086 [Malus domestica]
MKKVHIALGIPAKYREWRWLLSLLRWEKSRLPPNEEIKQINDEAFAHLITVVEPVANEGGKKKSFSPAHEPSAEKKPMTSFAALTSSFATEKLIINLTSRTKNFVESEPMKPASLKVATTITEKIA